VSYAAFCRYCAIDKVALIFYRKEIRRMWRDFITGHSTIVSPFEVKT